MSAATGPGTNDARHAAGPLTLGTAGHVDHGKTALVRALTGVDADRLPEERARGLTIALGYAPLELPSGRRLSLVDVPGHERFVRTMVAGASGIDGFLMVVAADDGVMPQTLEHATVLEALGVEHGVVAVTKADVTVPTRAAAEAAELLPGCEVVACSARSGAGIDALRAALERLAVRLPSRAAGGGPVRLHVDRAFTVAGRGTVVTGTLWSGAIEGGDELELLRPGREPLAVRVRGLHVHEEAVERADAGQRVAANLTGVRVRDVARGYVLATPGALGETTILDCALAFPEGIRARHGERVQVHHGARDASGRLALLSEEDGLWQLRLERPLLALDGDRLVVRRLAPPDTLGGGVVLDAAARRHGRRPEIVARLRRLRDGEPAPAAALGADGAAPAVDGPAGDAALAAAAGGRPPTVAAAPQSVPPVAARDLDRLEARLRDAGPALLSEAQMDGEATALRMLRASGRAMRVSGRLYAHAAVVEQVREQVVALLGREGPLTLAAVRDALGLSRKSAQAFLEHLDAERVTRRLPDDRRELLRRRVSPEVRR